MSKCWGVQSRYQTFRFRWVIPFRGVDGKEARKERRTETGSSQSRSQTRRNTNKSGKPRRNWGWTGKSNIMICGVQSWKKDDESPSTPPNRATKGQNRPWWGKKRRHDNGVRKTNGVWTNPLNLKEEKKVGKERQNSSHTEKQDHPETVFGGKARRLSCRMANKKRCVMVQGGSRNDNSRIKGGISKKSDRVKQTDGKRGTDKRKWRKRMRREANSSRR